MIIEKHSGFKAELAIAETFDEIKLLETKASVVAEFARKNKLGLDEQNQWGIFRTEIEDKKGGWLEKQFPSKAHSSRTLRDEGITFDESSNARLIHKEADLKQVAINKIIGSGKIITPNAVSSKIRSIKKEQKREIKQEKKQQKYNATYSIFTQDIKTYNPTTLVDHIITDPPYPKEYLSLLNDLAVLAIKCLKPNGNLLVMIGQSYLPDVFKIFQSHNDLKYNWTLSYLTPGGQSVQLWNRKVNTFWKPVLWYTNGEYNGDWIGDVLKSRENDNDKRFHKWGQSESGMLDIIDKFTYPGDIILDPFLGGGATAVVAINNDRNFIGFDVDDMMVEKTKKRIENGS